MFINDLARDNETRPFTRLHLPNPFNHPFDRDSSKYLEYERIVGAEQSMKNLDVSDFDSYFLLARKSLFSLLDRASPSLSGKLWMDNTVDKPRDR